MYGKSTRTARSGAETPPTINLPYATRTNESPMLTLCAGLGVFQPTHTHRADGQTLDATPAERPAGRQHRLVNGRPRCLGQPHPDRRACYHCPPVQQQHTCTCTPPQYIAMSMLARERPRGQKIAGAQAPSAAREQPTAPELQLLFVVVWVTTPAKGSLSASHCLDDRCRPPRTSRSNTYNTPAPI